MIRNALLVTLVFVFVAAVHAQNEGFYPEQDTIAELDVDSIPVVKARLFEGPPGKAALYSLILPGAGQVYNKRYWQVPIVWAGVGTAGYFMIYNNKQYQSYSDAYRGRIIAERDGTIPTDEYFNFSDEQIKTRRDRWNRYRQISIFVFALTWIANSAHAYVDAHLKNFDVSDDLSIQIVPIFGGSDLASSQAFSAGIGVRF